MVSSLCSLSISVPSFDSLNYDMFAVDLVDKGDQIVVLFIFQTLGSAEQKRYVNFSLIDESSKRTLGRNI